MKKMEFLEMLVKDNETEQEPKKSLYADVIECMDIALSQESDTFEVDNNKNVVEAFSLIEKEAKDNKKNCVGPFEAAEILAKYLGSSYVRVSKRYSSVAKEQAKVSLEDFL